MLPQIRAISFTNFRNNATQEINYVSTHQAHLWIMKHGVPVASVISMRDEDVLSRIHGRNLGEMMARMEVDQDRIKEAMITSKEYLKYEVVGQEWTYPVFGLVGGKDLITKPVS
jgi:PHD/YefM family antitoxin component YafN of YafNO toxin-antitoxin module